MHSLLYTYTFSLSLSLSLSPSLSLFMLVVYTLYSVDQLLADCCYRTEQWLRVYDAERSIQLGQSETDEASY